MGDKSAEGLVNIERLGELQKQLARQVDQVHDGAGAPLFGETRVYDGLFAINRLYRQQVPEGYHLLVGLTPKRWYEFQKHEELKLLTKKETSSTGPRYYLHMPGFIVNPRDMSPDRSGLQLFLDTIPSNPQASKLGLQMVSSKGVSEMGESILPQDLLSIEVVADSHI